MTSEQSVNITATSTQVLHPAHATYLKPKFSYSIQPSCGQAIRNTKNMGLRNFKTLVRHILKAIQLLFGITKMIMLLTFFVKLGRRARAN